MCDFETSHTSGLKIAAFGRSGHAWPARCRTIQIRPEVMSLRPERRFRRERELGGSHTARRKIKPADCWLSSLICFVRGGRWFFSLSRRCFFVLQRLEYLSGVHTPKMVGKTRPGNLITMSCLCPGHRHSVRLLLATPVVSNAGHVPILSWCTVYGRNTNAGFLSSVYFPRRGSIAIS